MGVSEELYRREADFLLRENMNKLKGMIDLLSLGILDTMDEAEKDDFLAKMRANMNTLYEKLEASIAKET